MNGRPTRPGWPEILAAAAVYVLVFWLAPPAILAVTGDSEAVTGLALAALSGVMGLLAFAAAAVIRLRSWSALGVRRVSGRWVLIAVGAGLGAVLIGRLLAIAIVPLVGTGGDVQGSYGAAATSGPLGLVLQLLFIAVLTPIGEEFAFRGVLTNALQRYGAVLSVIASTIVFALAHGVNLALVPAVAVGAVSGVLFVRSKSVWPGVIVHAVNNAVGTGLTLLFAGA
ncbi:type II CAAX endopeptidase family protein [Schumannella luteola]